MGSSNRGSSRREFFKTVAVAAGSAGALAACGNSATSPSKPAVDSSAPTTDGLPLKVGGLRYDRTDALVDGRVPVEGCAITFEEAHIGDINTHVFSGPQTIEVTEIGLHPYMLAYANDGFRDYSLIPVFPLRLFRHKSVYIRTDRGIKDPEDLRGRTIATPGYSSTSLTWLRGIFQHQYGITPNDVEWVIASSDSDARSGKTSKQELALPEAVPIRQGPAGVDESELLVSGEVDALFHAAEPKAFREGNPIVGRLFPDYRRVERAYFAETGIFPIMHAVAVRNDVIEDHPWLLEAVFTAYSRAKQKTYDYLKNSAWYKGSLPWIGQEFEETRELMGDNYWPYGIAPNRKVLEAFFEYSHEQGLASRRLTIEELFHPSTLEFVEEGS
ncbi:MAG: ABC transporter substrate-binding protein [Thermoanaerobaculales bacterium]|nr:ABC transporter substrate-binding protein [Thermoanaerobaculales bacterium]